MGLLEEKLKVAVTRSQQAQEQIAQAAEEERKKEEEANQTQTA